MASTQTRNVVYLVVTREFLRAKYPVFKPGRTKDIARRMKEYARGSLLLTSVPVGPSLEAMIDAERAVLAAFHSAAPFFYPMPSVGHEYFRCTIGGGDMHAAARAAMRIFHAAAEAHVYVPDMPDMSDMPDIINDGQWGPAARVDITRASDEPTVSNDPNDPNAHDANAAVKHVDVTHDVPMIIRTFVETHKARLCGATVPFMDLYSELAERVAQSGYRARLDSRTLAKTLQRAYGVEDGFADVPDLGRISVLRFPRLSPAPPGDAVDTKVDPVARFVDDHIVSDRDAQFTLQDAKNAFEPLTHASDPRVPIALQFIDTHIDFSPARQPEFKGRKFYAWIPKKELVSRLIAWLEVGARRVHNDKVSDWGRILIQAMELRRRKPATLRPTVNGVTVDVVAFNKTQWKGNQAVQLASSKVGQAPVDHFGQATAG